MTCLPPQNVILECQDAHYTYPGSSAALQGLDIAFEKGKRHAVLGPNGAGKSTLFMLLNGVLKPGRGQVLLDGAPLNYDRKSLFKVRARVGVLFQDPDAQLLSFSVREDISFGPMNLGLDQTEVKARVDDALQACFLESLADRPVHALSYGEKKRVGLAGLLAMSPDVLILDEPTAGLDGSARDRFLALLDALHQKGITLILSTHSTDLAYAWADVAHVLQRGRCVAKAERKDFPATFRQFETHGLKTPRCLVLAECLMTHGLLKTWPQSEEDLMEALKTLTANERK